MVRARSIDASNLHSVSTHSCKRRASGTEGCFTGGYAESFYSVRSVNRVRFLHLRIRSTTRTPWHGCFTGGYLQVNSFEILVCYLVAWAIALGLFTVAMHFLKRKP